MKTVVHIELSDPERNMLARLLDAKSTRRLVTREEVRHICHQAIQRHLTGLASCDPVEWDVDLPADTSDFVPAGANAELWGRSLSYRAGWRSADRRLRGDA